jgi:L-alanine-DL-glutamate epimerase-like enolase superfamily enzyme
MRPCDASLHEFGVDQYERGRSDRTWPGTSVRIKSIEPIAVSLPMARPVKMAGETVARAQNVLVRVESEDGHVGWGEAAAAPTMTGETVASMMAAVDHMSPALLKRAADDFAGAGAAMDLLMHGNSGAKAAIEIALHDLVGRATGRPVHALLGAKKRDRIALLAVLGAADVAGDVQEAKQRRAAGYVIYKVKVGIGSPEADAARTQAACQALGQDCLVSADANQGWDAAQAIRFVRAVAGSGLGFFEQPVRADDLAGMAEVAAASAVPIGADEGIHGRDDIERHYERRAASGVSLKAIKLGGLRAVLEAGRLCDRLGMKVNISCKTGESSVASAAALHVAAVVPALAWGLTVTSLGLAEDVVAAPLRADGGHIRVLDGPGLGIEVDESRVRRCQRDFIRNVA